MMSIGRLKEGALSTFLGLSSWDVKIEHNLDNDHAVDRRKQIDCERETIRSVLVRSESGLDAGAVFSLRKPVEIAAVVGRATAEQYSVLAEICDALRGDDFPRLVAEFDDCESWNQAIMAARRKRILSDLFSLDSFSRAHAVGASILRVEQAGYKVGLSAFGSFFDADELKRICNCISGSVQDLGGRAVAEAILKQLHLYHGSFLYGRRVEQIPQPRYPSVPWHYLYNLAMRHFDCQPKRKDFEKGFAVVCDLARDMASVIDVEPYCTFEQMGISLTAFHNSILDRVVYDELFAFQQWQPEVASQIFSLWLRHLSDAGCVFPIATVKEWEAFGQSLFSKAQVSSFFVTHPAEYVSEIVDLDLAVELSKAVSVEINALNEGYLTPLDTSKRNNPGYPIYQYSDDLYLIPPLSMVGRALYEGIYRLLREANISNLEKMMGDALEHLTGDAIALTGEVPLVLGEKYRLPGQKKALSPYEVDVAAESDERVFLFECKKKPLTNAARGGNSLKATIDFSQAFLHPLVQLNRHEAQLRTKSGIDFLNGQQLQLNDREVQRVIVSMTDHGSMQDRIFVRSMLTELWGMKLTSGDLALQGEADKVNQELSALATGITSLAEQVGEDLSKFLNRYALSTRWFGIDQLFFVCSRAANLWEALSMIGAVTFGSGDTMAEIAYYDSMLRSSKNH